MAERRNLQIVITTLDRFTRPFQQLQARVNSTSRSLRGLNERLNLSRGFAGLRSAVGGMVRLFSRIGLAAAGVGTAVFLALRRLSEFGDTIAKTARRLGIGAQQFQAYRFGAERSGVSTEQFDKALEKLNQNVGDAKAGTGTLTYLLKKSSPAFLKQIVNAKDVGEAFKLMVKAISRVEDPTKRASLATAAFGRAGKPLLNYLALGEVGVAKLNAKFDELGGGLSDKTLQASEDFTDSLANLKVAGISLASTVGEKLLPQLTEWIKSFTDWIAKNREWIATKINDAIDNLADSLKQIGDFAKKAYPGVSALYDALGGAKGIAIIGVAVVLAQVAASIAAIVSAIAAAPIVGIVAGIVAAFVTAAAVIYKYWEPIREFFLGLFRDLTEGFKKIADGLASLSLGKVEEGLLQAFSATPFGLIGRGIKAGAEAFGFTPSDQQVSGNIGVEVRVKDDRTQAVVTSVGGKGPVGISADAGMSYAGP
jgi:hypothetical protein